MLRFKPETALAVKRRHFIATIAVVLPQLLAASGITEAAFSAAYKNDSKALSHALKHGADPNSRNSEGASLLYVATGPKGGLAVVQVLIKAGANPNLGHGRYTPLMNAASWANLEVVSTLLDAGADPRLLNDRGETAAQVVGSAGGKEQAVIARLEQAQAQAKAPTPNPSIERTLPGKPVSASHVKR